MKIRADEHVSPYICQAVRDLGLSPGWELTQVTEVGDRASTDEHWATQFSKAGGDAILSGDTDFLRRHHLILAIGRMGLRVIHMPSKWSNARADLQAAHILVWWRRIEQTVSTMKPRECYRPPWTISEDGELIKIGIDYQGAERKEKREAKRETKSESKAEPKG